MKCFLFSIVIVCLLNTTTAYSQSENPLVGTWQLISSKGSHGQQQINNDSTKIHMTKSVTPKGFMFAIYDKQKDSLLMSAQGTIAIKSDRYSETITHSTMKEMIGLTFHYNYTLADNKWKIEGGGNNLRLLEEWVKIK